LYSGEQFDSKIGQQYLRARYYDPVTGRFNRLDPFFGNLNDPQSLHKYLYIHADPINGIDPSGEVAIFWLLGKLLAVSYAAFSFVVPYAVPVILPVAAIIIGRALYVNMGFPSLQPYWHQNSGARPSFEDRGATWYSHPRYMLEHHKYRENVYFALLKTIKEKSPPNSPPTEIEKNAAWKFASDYVDLVKRMAGNGQGGWYQSVSFAINAWFGIKRPPNCNVYADEVRSLQTSEPWAVRKVENSHKGGGSSYFAAVHNFVLLTYNGEPVWVLDPWQENRPEIYEPEPFEKVWPFETGSWSTF
jgi:RHS repeat-associated protein